MSIVHTLISGSPVLVMILSHFLFSKEDKFTWLKLVASVMLIVGVLLNTNPIMAFVEAVSKVLCFNVPSLDVAVLGKKIRSDFKTEDASF